MPNGIKEEYNYDDMGRLTQIAYGTTGRTISYSYDLVGNVIQMTDWTGTTTYSYDNIYQLTSATYPNTGTQTFTYDRAGNRIQDQNRTYYYNNLNQLLYTSDGTNYSYDANGNLISKTKNNQTTTYTWNEFDRLVEVNLPDGKKIKFVYGQDGLRRERIEEERVNYLLDGLIVLAEFDDGLNLLREYVGGVSVCFGSESFYYHYDRLGSVRFLTDAGGNIIQEYNYDAFGNLLSSSGSLNQPYEYVGREGYYREVVFNLYLLGQRWYDSEAGRFISRNSPYTFKKNNPINSINIMGTTGKMYNDDRIKPRHHFEGPVRCAKRIADEVKETVPAPLEDTDSYYWHCVASCRISRECPGGKLTARIAGWWQDPPWSRTEDRECDLKANQIGRDLADSSKSCEEACMEKWNDGTLKNLYNLKKCRCK